MELTPFKGVITSPEYPREYGPELSCMYKIFAPTGKRIRLVFEEFIVESLYDVVMVLPFSHCNAVVRYSIIMHILTLGLRRRWKRYNEACHFQRPIATRNHHVEHRCPDGPVFQ